MGLGDDLMFLGEAEIRHEMTGKKVTPTVGGRTAPWSVVWDNVPFLERSADGSTEEMEIRPYHGNRPYIESWVNGRIVYRDYRPIPALIRFTEEEIFKAENNLKEVGIEVMEDSFIVLNPDTKNTTLADNKDWGWDKWVELAARLTDEGHKVVRLKPGVGEVYDASGRVVYDKPDLPGAINIVTNNPRDAFAILSFADAVVTTEGGMHHAAAAVNTAAVVIFGAVISPRQTGYSHHKNIYVDGPDSPCGKQTSCRHCREAMESISVDDVLDDLDIFL